MNECYGEPYGVPSHVLYLPQFTNPTVTDFHTASLDQKEYLEQYLPLTEETCWDHNGFMVFWRDVCDHATSTMCDGYTSQDYRDVWTDGTPLEVIMREYREGSSASDVADDLLQGEAEAASEQQFRDHVSY